MTKVLADIYTDFYIVKQKKITTDLRSENLLFQLQNFILSHFYDEKSISLPLIPFQMLINKSAFETKVLINLHFKYKSNKTY